MAEEKTAEQVKAERIEKLGPKLGPVFHALSDDVAWLRVKWAEYRELFGTSPERIELLNSAAGLFFRILQDTLWEDALLNLARLTDPPKIRGKHNLTIQALPELCDDPALRLTVSQFGRRGARSDGVRSRLAKSSYRASRLAARTGIRCEAALTSE